MQKDGFSVDEPAKKEVSKKDKKLMTGETNDEMGAIFAKTSVREEITENPDHTDTLTVERKGSLESTMKKTMESTEHGWNKYGKCQDTLENIGEEPCAICG